MTLRPRLELDDIFASAKSCTICGASALSVVHLKSFPDYVSCAACGAAFVVEDGGDRAMYGSIPPEYPETRDFALKQWTSLEAIAALAEAERPEARSANNSGFEEAVRPAAAAPDDPPLAPLADDPPPDDLAGDQPLAALADHPPPDDLADDQPLAALADDLPREAAEQLGAAVAQEPFTATEPEAEGEPFAAAEPEAELDLAPEVEPPHEPFDWPAPAPELPEPAPEPLAAEELFDWPAPAPEFPEPQTAEEPFAWPEPASELEPAEKPPFGAAALEPAQAEEPQLVEAAAAEPEPARMPEAAAAEPLTDQSWEPEPGRRYRVRFLGTEARIPTGVCAHCLRNAPKRTLVAVGAVIGPGGQPKRHAFNLPLCSHCHRRARAKSEEERAARLMAHLISVLVAAVGMVGALATGLVPLDSPLLAGGLLAVLGIGGYGLPAWLLLGRAARFPPPQDALFVRSTLLVSAHPQAGETLFDWRSPGFASLFMEANPEQAGEHLFEVADPLAARGIPADEHAA